MYIGFVLALLCAFAALSSGLGYRLGLWHFRTGFKILTWSAFLSGAVLIILLAGMFFIQSKTRMDSFVGFLGLIICLVMVYVPYSWKRMLDAHPYIHDITTDTLNPPDFVVVRSLRNAEHHSTDYDGLEVAEQQKKAYPELKTLVVDAQAENVRLEAVDVLMKMGLEIVSSEADSGRIEATATTFLYGFKDDVVVRIVEDERGSMRIDVRSKSRVGKNDFGQNAKRIRQFTNGLMLRFAKG
ncbi:MAG: DUF1499 domain-containing protein [Proteobacteria bacterium]|nr:DUF1499 domain-containing protein [Pseudomonadota bacterium]